MDPVSVPESIRALHPGAHEVLIAETQTDLAFIYVLTDPRTHSVGYVGTTLTPDRRLKMHLCIPHNPYQDSPRYEWFREMAKAGVSPRMFVIEVVNAENGRTAEKAWIKYYRDRGQAHANSNCGRRKEVKPQDRDTSPRDEGRTGEP